MKYLVLLTLLAPLSLFADARIEVTDNFCHAPWDNGNTDNEAYLSNCGAVLNVTNGIADGYAILVKKHVSVSAIPVSIDPRDTDEYPTGEASVSTSGADSGAACVMVDSNGTNYQAASWDVVTTAERESQRWLATVTYQIECWNGQQAAQ